MLVSEQALAYLRPYYVVRFAFSFQWTQLIQFSDCKIIIFCVFSIHKSFSFTLFFTVAVLIFPSFPFISQIVLPILKFPTIFQYLQSQF